MFKSQRRYKVPQNECVKKIPNNIVEVEEVYNSKTRRPQFGDKYKTNRCTIIKPSYKDFGQFTEILQSPNTYKNTFREQFGIAAVIPETIEKLKELKQVIGRSDTKLDATSSYDTAGGKSTENLIENSSDETQWQNVDNISDVHEFIPRKQMKSVRKRYQRIIPTRGEKHDSKKANVPRKEVKLVNSREEKIIPSGEVKIMQSVIEDNIPTKEVNNTVQKNVLISEDKPHPPPFPTNVRISEVPRIKIMAEKFTMFKKNNIELRRLEEKVVCLEYDIFDKDDDNGKPVQRMRAFFSIKPQSRGGGSEDIALIPSEVKRDFDIVEEDLNKLNKKEIEIIDEHIPENRSLLEDLKKVLRRNQILRHKKGGPLDLIYLYEIAKRQNQLLDEKYLPNNVLSKKELDEIKEMIMKKSVSSIHVSRRKVRHINTQGDAKDREACDISDSLVMELMREVKIDTDKA